MSSHPLTTRAFWRLSSGSSMGGLPCYVGAAIWLLGSCMLLAWLAALGEQARVWGLSAVFIMLVAALAVAWFVAAWVVWSRWRTSASPLTLEWTGLPMAAPSPGRDRTPLAIGFRVMPWRVAVRADVMLDLQRWMLLRLRACAPADAALFQPAAWAWLDMRAEADGGQAAMHQLRTLLYLPPTLRNPQADMPVSAWGQNAEQPEPMASWATTFNPGSMLLRSVFSRGGRGRAASTASRADAFFPPTQILLDERGERALAGRDDEVQP